MTRFTDVSLSQR